MISLLAAFAALTLGFILYGRLTQKVFSPDDRATPAIAFNDDVDCVPMKPWRSFLIQFLNIAGTGPIFGALMGAQFGPIVFLWVVLGSIFGGAVHDYMCGMISGRHCGASVAELSGIYLGKTAKWIVRFFSIILLLLVGTVFVTSPAILLAYLTPEKLSTTFWVVVILIYYAIATLFPIDKVIGKVYPVFGIVLIIMAVGILGSIIFLGKYQLPELTLQNLHPDNTPVWPYMFVTVACGAVSGFHSTQSPMMAKCITSEKQGRVVFYGAMILEAVVALIWAAAGMAFYQNSDALKTALNASGQAGVVYDISMGMMGKFGGVLAVIGVVICPISSGDTAFRSVRLIMAEWTHLDQKKISNRLLLTVPILVVGAVLSQINFDMLWRYFSWSNQSLAAIMLWIASSYLIKKGKYKYGSLLTALPATFMTGVCVTYIMMAPEGFRLPADIGYSVGIGAAVAMAGLYALMFSLHQRSRKK